MGLPSAVFLAAGLVLCVLEIFNSFKGRLAGMGAGLMLTGVIVRMLHAGTPFMLFWMLMIAGTIIAATYLTMIRVMRYNWLTRTPAIQGGVPGEGSETAQDHYYLLGREGISVTGLSPAGKVRIDNAEITASAKSGTVNAGEKVRVIEVEDGQVYVLPVLPHGQRA